MSPPPPPPSPRSLLMSLPFIILYLSQSFSLIYRYVKSKLVYSFSKSLNEALSTKKKKEENVSNLSNKHTSVSDLMSICQDSNPANVCPEGVCCTPDCEGATVQCPTGVLPPDQRRCVAGRRGECLHDALVLHATRSTSRSGQWESHAGGVKCFLSTCCHLH